jgi:hypothetical protein
MTGPARLRFVVLCILSGVAGGTVAPAQDSNTELRPELNVYVQLQPIIRIQFSNSFFGDLDEDNWRSNSTIWVESALKPVLRRRLRVQPDVYRERYLTFRVGYRYRADLGGGPHENRLLVETTSRYPLPAHFLISDRNRGEFRFVQNRAFSTRYRNRLRLEYDYQAKRFEATPYIDIEFFYDTRYDAWARRQYELGLQLPINKRVMLEPYYLRQDNTVSSPPHLNAIGFKLNLYF